MWPIYFRDTGQLFEVLGSYETKLRSLSNQNSSIREYQNGSIVATLGLSHEALKAQNPTAAALLGFCGCLDNTDIFWKLFEFGFHIPHTSDFPQVMVPALSWIPDLDPNWFQKIQTDEEQYDGAVRSLLMFSFAKQNFETSSISIHPIVHQWSLSLYNRDLRNQILEKIADIISRFFMQDNPLNPTPSNEALFNRLRPHADRCFALIRSERANVGWAAATLISFGFYFSRQYKTECAKYLVKAGLPLLEREEKCVISVKCLKLRAMLSTMYKSWDQDHDKSLANLRAGQKLARALSLQVKDDTIPVFEISFARDLSHLYVKQGSYSEACEMWDLAVDFAQKTGDPIAYWTAMIGKMEVRLLVGDAVEAVRLGEVAAHNLRRLLEAETAANPSGPSMLYIDLEKLFGVTQKLLGWGYAKLENWETCQENYLSALINSEKIFGPTSSIALARSADYMGVVGYWVAKGFLEQEQKWHNTVHDVLIAANPNRVVQSVKKRQYGSCSYDRWTLIFSAVRTSIRHRPGTELYSRLSKMQPVYFLSR